MLSPGTKTGVGNSSVELPLKTKRRPVIMKNRAPSPPAIEKYLHHPPTATAGTQEDERFDIYEEVVNFGNIMEPRSGVITLRNGKVA
jgi:hypothetical protein